MMQYVRKNILPKSWEDFFVTTFVVLIIPTVYWFELFVVLPTFYMNDSLWYKFHFVMGTFILANVCSNFLAVIICDTSIKGRMLPSTPEDDWRFCTVCESTAPPRSWHCAVCNVCILKRDHHCIFTGCCVGHYNLRYFLMFVFYIFISTLYATYYNVQFLWTFVELRTFLSFTKLIFPLAMIFVEYSLSQIYLFLCLIIVFGGVFTGVLLYYHTDLMLRGMVTYEKNHKIHKFDMGRKANLVEVLGEKWYLVWLCPFIVSKLPSDGINWDVANSVKAK